MYLKYIFASLIFIGTLSAMESNRATQDLQDMVQAFPDEYQKVMQKDVLNHLAKERPRDFIELMYNLPEITSEQADAVLSTFDIKRHHEYVFNLFAAVRSERVKESLDQVFYQKNLDLFKSNTEQIKHFFENKEFKYSDKIIRALELDNCSIRDTALLIFIAQYRNNVIPTWAARRYIFYGGPSIVYKKWWQIVAL